MKAPELPTLAFADTAAWEAWLEEHHGSAPGVWVRIAKKGSGLTSVSYDQAVEVALCFGWIDGLARSLDEREYLQRFTPRRARSSWSASNRERVRMLVESRRMRPAGLQAVERAQQSGLWDPAGAADGSRREG